MLRGALLLAAVLALGVGLSLLGGRFFTAEVENAEERLTIYEDTPGEPSIYVNDRWYARRDVETLLIIGVDDMGQVQGADSYNSGHQADFLLLLVQDRDSKAASAIHINRDTMADVPVLGVSGDAAGTRREQIALAYYYGSGEQDSCENTVSAVSNLLYGVEIGHYFALTMDAVPILNDWAGGVRLQVQDDFTGIDADLVQGRESILWGDDALHYVRSRAGVGDETNLSRMQRQRQYAEAWFDQAQPLFRDYNAMAELMNRMEGVYFTDCTLEELKNLAQDFSADAMQNVYTLEGEAAVQSLFMEYHVNEESLQQLVLDLFYVPVEG